MERSIQPMNFEGNLSENWRTWRKRFEIYSVASELIEKPENIQCARLLHLMGDQGINISETFLYGDDEENKIEILKQKFQDYFVPRKNLLYERHKFFTYRQTVETTEQFATELKKRALQCEFDKMEDAKSELIKSILVMGIKDEATREKLLEKDGLTLEKAIECCIVTENSRKQLKEMSVIPEMGHVGTIRKQIQGRSNEGAKWKRTDQGHWRTSKPMDSRQEQRKYQPKENIQVINNCTRCGKNHLINKCPAYGKTCSRCSKLNHFANFCKNFKIRTVVLESQNDNFKNDNLTIDNVQNENENSCTMSILTKVGNKNFNVNYKVDSGACANLISLNQLNKMNFDTNHIYKTNDNLVTYSRQKIPIIGKCKLIIKFKNKSYLTEFYVNQEPREALLGLKTITALKIITINKEISSVDKNVEGYKNIINKNLDLFQGIGRIGKPYHIETEEDVKPIKMPVRLVPFALENKFKECLNSMEQLKIIKRVRGCSDWLNSFVLVQKADNSLRICLDPQGLNKVIKNHTYKLPNIDEITSKLSNSKVYSTLDAASGFWNIPLDESSSKLCTFGTPFGRYQFLRMPFGIKIASEVFQEHFKEIFEIPGVEIYIDDILIHAPTKEQHDKTLNRVLSLARKHNVKFNLEKCKFGLQEVNYLGHKISNNGLTIDDRKIEAIRDMPSPKNKKDIQRFLGFVTYVGKFVKNLSEKTHPLRELLKINNAFVWEEHHEKSFNEIKNEICKDITLRFFNPNEQVIVSVDASKYGLGAVLIQNNLPCAYASRAMTNTQQQYAQIEKELLAICFGVKKFHQFVYGRNFIIETDHQPLVTIVKKPLHDCPARLQRMLLSLQRYNFTLTYKPGKQLIIADTLSRAFINKEFHNNLNLEGQVCMVESKVVFNNNSLNELIAATKNDEELKQISIFCKNGWPTSINKVNSNLKPYYKLKAEITHGTNELLYMAQRIIIPNNLRNKILNHIHTGHFGITKCIQKAKNYVYWPNIVNNIENLVSRCAICNKYQNSNKKEPMQPHDVKKQPWQKLSIDIFQIKDQYYLLVVDYYSKYPEVVNLNKNLTSKNIIENLKQIFARHGIPQIVVSDSGTNLISDEYQKFAKEWNFQIIAASPHHQQSNGMAERTIQTIKKLIKKCSENNEDVNLALLAYRNTPVLDMYTPAQILMSRRLRDHMPIIEKNLNSQTINQKAYNAKLNEKIENSKIYYNSKGVKKLSDIEIGSSVWYQDKPKSTWKQGKVVEKIRFRTYKVEKEDGRQITRNRIFIKPNYSLISNANADPKSESTYVYDPDVGSNNNSKNVISDKSQSDSALNEKDGPQTDSALNKSDASQSESVLNESDVQPSKKDAVKEKTEMNAKNKTDQNYTTRYGRQVKNKYLTDFVK